MDGQILVNPVPPRLGERDGLRDRLIVRHGQPASVINQTYQGPDVPLTAQGEQEALLLARHLASIARVDRIIHGPLIRQQQTAIILGRELGVPVEEQLYFGEIVLPQTMWGRSWGDLKAQQEARDFWQCFYASGLAGSGEGERFSQVYQRALDGFHYLQEQPDHCLICVTSEAFECLLYLVALLGPVVTAHLYRQAKERMGFGMASYWRLTFNAQHRPLVQAGWLGHKPWA